MRGIAKTREAFLSLHGFRYRTSMLSRGAI
jgi:hypothetical protein